MAFGILEDYKMERPPGTSFMTDDNDLPPNLSGIPRQVLKHDSKSSNIILVPQPSDDPNDPLNWPLWQKDLILLIVGLSAAVVGAFGPMLSPGFVQISAELGISVNTLSQSTAWLILTIGASLFFANPMAKMYGKRPVYILAIIIMFVGSVWGAESKDYSSFLGSRVFSGFGMAPYEVLVQCTIGDLYFVHQRATRIAAWNLCLLCGIAGGGLVSGYIIQDIGWKWTFWICAIFFGVFVVLVLLFVPETAYRRTPLEAQLLMTPLDNPDKEGVTLEQKEVIIDKELQYSQHSQEFINRKRMSWARSLRIFTGTYSKAPFWKIALRPLVIFWYPAVLWAFLIYGTGLVSLSPFLLTIIGEVVSGPLNDWICVRLTKRNHGIYEPEFRMVLVTVVLLLGIVGFYGFGASVHYQTHWMGPVLTFGIANMSVAFANVCVFGYVIDSYEALSEEAFVAINSRNFLTFGLTYFVNNWLAKSGALNVFNVLGSVFVAVCLLTIPLYVFGKRIRSKIARIGWLNRFMKDE